MTDGFRTGWDQALWLASYLFGAVWPLLIVAAFVALGWWIGSRIEHWFTVTRIRRQQRRSGRAAPSSVWRATLHRND